MKKLKNALRNTLYNARHSHDFWADLGIKLMLAMLVLYCVGVVGNCE